MERRGGCSPWGCGALGGLPAAFITRAAPAHSTCCCARQGEGEGGRRPSPCRRLPPASPPSSPSAARLPLARPLRLFSACPPPSPAGATRRCTAPATAFAHPPPPPPLAQPIADGRLTQLRLLSKALRSEAGAATGFADAPVLPSREAEKPKARAAGLAVQEGLRRLLDWLRARLRPMRECEAPAHQRLAHPPRSRPPPACQPKRPAPAAAGGERWLFPRSPTPRPASPDGRPAALAASAAGDGVAEGACPARPRFGGAASLGSLATDGHPRPPFPLIVRMEESS